MKNKILMLLMLFTSVYASAETTKVVSCDDEYFTVEVNRNDDGNLTAILTRNGRIDGNVRTTDYVINGSSSKKLYQGNDPQDVRVYIKLELNGRYSKLEATFPDARSVRGIGVLTRGLGEGSPGLNCH